MGFKDDLAAAKASAEMSASTLSPSVQVAVNGVLYEVAFYRASTADWARTTMKNPPRVDVPLDLKNGYNLSAAARDHSVEYGRVVGGEEEVKLSAEEWADLWEVVSPTSARFIEATIWHMHEHDAEQEIERAKKASKPRPASRKKSS